MAKKKEQNLEWLSILQNKKVPILTLDPKWHELFPEHIKTNTIRELEKKVKELLKEQGKLVNDIKDMKKLKQRLMGQIVANMGEGSEKSNEKSRAKKQDVSQKMILEINTKLEESNDQLLDMPYKIREANNLLLVECMKIWYENLSKNAEEIKALEQWIEKAREELKRNLLIKQDKEMMNEAIYTYMHDLLGSDTIDKFDVNMVGDK
ncbi:hypothetical protein [Anaeromicropila populeti]|uniref:Uncharacterized protein n=1 Tax=Anaeromicropila populeti TaxID=37658 RepID=A0A1I6J8H0_9FIRM|nr:hypothetical protein [Anaeromicropila populeti]SFR75254.1 hypothetical protein SAMN05661086_01452 [Anaeromicropila populeti]